MFDWPLQTQTSPTYTEGNVTLLCPVMVIGKGPPAFIGFRVTLHFPS